MSKMSPAKKFLIYVLPPLLWMAFIFPVWNRALGSSRISVGPTVLPSGVVDVSTRAVGWGSTSAWMPWFVPQLSV